MLSSSILSSSERLAEVESKIASLEEERRRARASEFIFEERELSLKRLESFFIPSEKPVGFIESLEELARLTGNELSLDLVTGEPREGLFSFRITVEGTAESSSRYLALLELMPHEIIVEELSLQRFAGTPSGSAEKGKNERLIIIIAVKTL